MKVENKYLIKTVGLLIGDSENAEKLYKSFHTDMVYNSIKTLLDQGFEQIYCDMLAIMCVQDYFIDYLKIVNVEYDNAVISIDEELSDSKYYIDIVIDENILTQEQIDNFYCIASELDAELNIIIESE